VKQTAINKYSDKVRASANALVARAK